MGGVGWGWGERRAATPTKKKGALAAGGAAAPESGSFQVSKCHASTSAFPYRWMQRASRSAVSCRHSCSVWLGATFPLPL